MQRAPLSLLYTSPHIHKVLDRQPMCRHRAAQLSHKPLDLQVYLRNRGDFPPRRTGQWAKGEQPLGRLARTVDDGAIVGFHTDTQGIRNRQLAVTQFRDERNGCVREIAARPRAIDDMSRLEHSSGAAAQAQRDLNRSARRPVTGNAPGQDFQRTGGLQFGERITHAWRHTMPMNIPARAQMTHELASAELTPPIPNAGYRGACSVEHPLPGNTVRSSQGDLLANDLCQGQRGRGDLVVQEFGPRSARGMSS